MKSKSPGIVPNDFRDRTWYENGNAYAFLVDTPHTFGHTQLVLKIDNTEKEEDCFRKASSHVTSCIKKLRTALQDNFADDYAFLLRYTRTSGKYKKTLVLRVSARESKGEYKVHLVPYFESHFHATNKLYRATHDKHKKENGGLLHWLGLREVLLDYDMREGRGSEAVKKRIQSFGLQKLAAELRKAKA